MLLENLMLLLFLICYLNISTIYYADSANEEIY